MIKAIKYSGLLLCFLFLGKSMYAQDILQQKFHKAIESAYGTENFELKEITVPKNLANQMAVEMNDKNLYEVHSGGKLLGFAYLGEAPSKKRMFDYAVFFDENFIIKKSKVLIYREDFGRQIGTRRWLGQFDGMSPESKPEYGKNIAAISGATISATSMTRAVNGVLKSVAILQAENIL